MIIGGGFSSVRLCDCTAKKITSSAIPRRRRRRRRRCMPDNITLPDGTRRRPRPGREGASLACESLPRRNESSSFLGLCRRRRCEMRDEDRSISRAHLTTTTTEQDFCVGHIAAGRKKERKKKGRHLFCWVSAADDQDCRREGKRDGPRPFRDTRW